MNGLVLLGFVLAMVVVPVGTVAFLVRWLLVSLGAEEEEREEAMKGSGKAGRRVTYNSPHQKPATRQPKSKNPEKNQQKNFTKNSQKILTISLLIALFSLSATASALSAPQSGAQNLDWEKVEKKLIEDITNHKLPGTIIKHLEPSTDDQFKERLQSLMILVRYDTEYIEDIFDCSDQSKILHKYLEAHAYKAKIAYTYNERDKCGHAFVIVEDNDGKYVAVETITGNKCIGGIRNDMPGGIWYGPAMLLNSTEETDKWPMFD